MLSHLQLIALTGSGQAQSMKQIALTADLQDIMQQEWGSQFEAFCQDVREIEFDAGYKPDSDERFVIQDFTLPAWFELDREGLNTLDAFEATTNELGSLSALIAYGRNGNQEVILIQRFTKSHVIQPGRFLFIEWGTFRSAPNPCINLGSRPDAVFFPAEQKLVFANFRNANAILPLTDFYEEASESEIRQILTHNRLAPENIDGLAVGASQWFRTRFAMLRDSRVLDEYSPQQIRDDAVGYVDVAIEGDGENARIVFPSDKSEAKRLLQFLNEELYKGPITETLYETNSKREAD
jgi:hypothetical protein